MKLSELIAEAQRALAEYGDLEVVKGTDGCGYCDPPPYVPADTEVRDAEVWYGDEVSQQLSFVIDD